MEVAALALAIIAIASCTCLYVSIICGALSMILALLSKGGATSMSQRAFITFFIGLAAILITILVYTVSIVVMLNEYGSFEGILKAYSDMSGIDYKELIEQMNAAY